MLSSSRFGSANDDGSGLLAIVEGERQEKPPQALRVGSEFLSTACPLEGIAIEKILEVAAQVASEGAHEIDGRDVHPIANQSSISEMDLLRLRKALRAAG